MELLLLLLLLLLLPMLLVLLLLLLWAALGPLLGRSWAAMGSQSPKSPGANAAADAAATTPL